MIISLTTDFGLQDGYVGALKGVLLAQAPQAVLVDLAHDLPPFDIMHAAFVLRQAAPFFPPGTVHVAVVDPGVGGPRRGIIVARAGQYFVGPDNGIFSPFLDEAAVVHELSDPNLWRPNPDRTFHGRDLFAPTAAKIVLGMQPADCGPVVYDPVRLPAWEIHQERNSFVAAIVHIDRFGNAITALAGERLSELGDGAYLAQVGDYPPMPVARAYHEVKPGSPVAVIGSTGLLELAVREGNAAATFNLRRGLPVRISIL